MRSQRSCEWNARGTQVAHPSSPRTTRHPHKPSCPLAAQSGGSHWKSRRWLIGGVSWFGMMDVFRGNSSFFVARKHNNSHSNSVKSMQGTSVYFLGLNMHADISMWVSFVLWSYTDWRAPLTHFESTFATRLTLPLWHNNIQRRGLQKMLPINQMFNVHVDFVVSFSVVVCGDHFHIHSHHNNNNLHAAESFWWI